MKYDSNSMIQIIFISDQFCNVTNLRPHHCQLRLKYGSMVSQSRNDYLSLLQL